MEEKERRESARSRARWMLPGLRRRAPMNRLKVSHVVPAVSRIVAIYSRDSGKFGAPELKVLNPLLAVFEWLVGRAIFPGAIDIV